jgi:diguanylate cyclase (GGDEF)-like protein
LADLLALRIRWGVLGLVRGALALLTVVVPVIAGTTGAERLDALPAAGALAASAALFELGRRALGGLPRWLVGASLLVDGVCLVAAVALTDGPTGPLGLLLPVHLIAVTLLASYRTGLKVAMWHSLLLAVAYHAQRTGRFPGEPASQDDNMRAVVMVWLVALCTATCSAYNERELRRGRAGFRALAELGSQLERVDGPHAVQNALLEAVHRHTGIARAALIVRRDDHVEATNWPERRAVVVPFDEAVATDGAVARCWHGRLPVLVAALDPGHDPVLDGLLPGARNVALLPLSTEDGPLGVLAVERGGGRRARIPASVVELLVRFAAHAALVHRNATLVEEVRHLAAIDGLTGLPNRRSFDAALATEVERARRTGQPLSLILLDADHFKQVNDTYGHHAGDGVLQAIGRALASARAADVAARYGGEEFAVLLPACSAADAVRVAQGLRAAITGATGRLAVTASAGVASLSADVGDERALLAAADAALYRAKASGRDRTVLADGPPARGPSEVPVHGVVGDH